MYWMWSPKKIIGGMVIVLVQGMAGVLRIHIIMTQNSNVGNCHEMLSTFDGAQSSGLEHVRCRVR